MKLTQYQGTRVRITASYHPRVGASGQVASVNRRTRKLTILTKGGGPATALPNEVERVNRNTEYLELATKAPDDPGLEELLREAAKDAGFLEKKLFRGHARAAMPHEEPFRLGAAPSFTDLPDIALVYSHTPETWGGMPGLKALKTPHSQVRTAFLKIERPLVLKNLMTPVGTVLDALKITRGSRAARDLFEKVIRRGGKPDICIRHTGWDADIAYWAGHDRAADEFKIDSYAYGDCGLFVELALAAGFDGVIHKDTFKAGLIHLRSVNGKTHVEGLAKNATHTTWRPLKQENIKLADPVTKNDKGEIIPLKKRFCGKDIRGSTE